MDVLENLITQLSLERIEENLFRGQSQDLGWGTVFGGQVLGQALAAAAYTVPDDRFVHSLHAYFLRPGDVNKPIVYDVDRIRDGTSFVTRRVSAIQSGRPIFSLSASFHKHETGYQHQDAMPEVPGPETLTSEQELAKAWADKLPALLRVRATGARPFEHRPIGGIPDPFTPKAMPSRHVTWLRAVRSVADHPALHAYLLAYASDHGFIRTALQPHGVSWLSPGMQVSSIDHVMWFHRPFRVDEWLLYVVDSPSASGARGFVRGQIFRQDGTLVVSTAQEGLMRQHEV